MAKTAELRAKIKKQVVSIDFRTEKASRKSSCGDLKGRVVMEREVLDLINEYAGIEQKRRMVEREVSAWKVKLEEAKERLAKTKELVSAFQEAEAKALCEESTLFCPGSGAYRVAESFLRCYRSLKFGEERKRRQQKMLTQDDFFANCDALKEDEELEDMYRTVGLLAREASVEERMVRLPSQKESEKVQGDRPVSILELTQARSEKKSETKFRSVRKDDYERAASIVRLIDTCMEKMRLSKDGMTRKCAEVLDIEYLRYDTMDCLDAKKDLTYEDKAKLLGIARSTYIARKDKGVELFARLCVLQMQKSQKEFGLAVALILSEKPCAGVQAFTKPKNRGANIAEEKESELTILED